MIYTGSILAASICANTITGDKLVMDAITSREIASKTITANEIASKSITADELHITGGLSSLTADLGTVTAGVIKSGNYDSTGGLSGMKLTLSTGEWASRYTQISTDGTLNCSNIQATAGKIGLWTIDETTKALTFLNSQSAFTNCLTMSTPYDSYSYCHSEFAMGKLTMSTEFPSSGYTDYTQMGLDGFKLSATRIGIKTTASIQVNTFMRNGKMKSGTTFNSTGDGFYFNNLLTVSNTINCTDIESTHLVKGENLVCTNGLTAYYNATQAVFWSGPQLLQLYLKAKEAGWVT